MATPSEAEIIAQIQAAIHLLEEIREFGEADATNIIGLIDTLEQALEGDFTAETAAAANSIRATISATLDQHQALLYPLLLAWAKQLDIAETDLHGVITRIYDRMIASADRVESRQFTRGAAAAGGGNVGTGELLRLNVDAENMPLEASHSEVKTFECISDQSSGSDEHEEGWECRGQAAGKDLLEVSGWGTTARLRSLSARDSLLSNPSFSRFSGVVATPTVIQDWTVNTIANVELDQVNTYRDFPGDTTPTALKLDGNVTVTQALSVNRTRLNPGRPYLLQIAFNRQVHAGSGTLHLTLGSRTINVAVAAQTGWHLLRLALDTNLWFENFNQQDLTVTIALAGHGGGSILVDDCLLVPWTPLDGAWYCLIGGATPWLLEDTFTVTDTEHATLGVVQRHFWRMAGRYLPAATPAVNFADP